MNILTTIYNFFFKKKITHEQIVPEYIDKSDVEVEKFEPQVLHIKATKQRSMSWIEAKSLIMGGKMDSIKDN
jgi:hypothetical protein